MKLLSLYPCSFHFKSIDSTQNFLKRNYKKLKNLTFVFSDFQTAGKGRHGRKWISMSNANLLFSFLIKDPKLVKRFDTISLFVAVILKELLESYGLKNLEIKWPNDVYSNGKKIAGILLEGISKGNKLKAIVVGIGLNVNQIKFEEGLRIEPTSLKLELNKDINIRRLRKSTYKVFFKAIKKIDSSDYIKIANECSYLKNKEIEFEYNNKLLKGKALSINEDNSLSILYKENVIKIKSGEVNHIKKVE